MLKASITYSGGSVSSVFKASLPDIALNHLQATGITMSSSVGLDRISNFRIKHRDSSTILHIKDTKRMLQHFIIPILSMKPPVIYR